MKQTKNVRMRCAAGPGERVIYTVVAIVMAAFSAALFETSIFMGVIAGLLALAVAVMAITGVCASSWLSQPVTSSVDDHKTASSH